MTKLSCETVDILIDGLTSEINSMLHESGLRPIDYRILDCLISLHEVNRYLIQENEVNKHKISSLSQRTAGMAMIGGFK